MSTDEKLGRALAVEFDEDKLGLVTSIQLQINNNIINITNFDSGDWQKKMKAAGDWTMTVGFNWASDVTENNQNELETAALTPGAAGAISLGPNGTPASGDVSFTGDVIIEDYSLDASEANTQVTGSVTFSGNGALTRSVQSP